jgi:hypothetical protein
LPSEFHDNSDEQYEDQYGEKSIFLGAVFVGYGTYRYYWNEQHYEVKHILLKFGNRGLWR